MKVFCNPKGTRRRAQPVIFLSEGMIPVTHRPHPLLPHGHMVVPEEMPFEERFVVRIYSLHPLILSFICLLTWSTPLEYNLMLVPILRTGRKRQICSLPSGGKQSMGQRCPRRFQCCVIGARIEGHIGALGSQNPHIRPSQVLVGVCPAWPPPDNPRYPFALGYGSRVNSRCGSSRKAP